MAPIPKNDERIELRAPTEDAARWREAADAERMTLSDWIRRQCNAATPPTKTTKKGGK